MIRLKRIIMRNCLSVGNVPQVVELDVHPLTLIIGENVDQGGGDSRNGVGKTTLIQAISYAIFDDALTSIKKDNLINKVNQKNMMVTLEYENGSKKYKIERGRKPSVLNFYVNDGLVKNPNLSESQGENKWTQKEIEKSFGMSIEMFRTIIALHTKIVPFLSRKANDQRMIIEELFGFTQLTRKAENLKEQIKAIKDEIRGEEIRIKTIMDSNKKIQDTINDLHFRNKVWEAEHEKKLSKLESSIAKLNDINIEEEIENHKKKEIWFRVLKDLNDVDKEVTRLDKMITYIDKTLISIDKNINSANEHSCPTCGQEVHDEKHHELLDSLIKEKEALLKEKKELQNELTALEPIVIKKAEELQKLGSEPVVFYDTIDDAYSHKNTLEKLCNDYAREKSTVSPYIDQIANLHISGIQEIDDNYLNELNKVKEHQEFLLKLLTSKESFIRKKIIDQNMAYLNSRMNYYLEKLNLPHEIEFKSDMSVEITLLGKEYDFEQISNGESTRLILALSWAFRDVWESLNQPINILFIDELVDSGMDAQGMDAALDILKKTSRERNKNIFLISHKDDLRSRVPNILNVRKENGFTSYESDIEIE